MPAPIELTHILLDDVSVSTQKTKRWAVLSKYGDGPSLGTIYWCTRWRKYAFYPQPNCIFEEVCMRELSDFIVTQTKAHKEYRYGKA